MSVIKNAKAPLKDIPHVWSFDFQGAACRLEISVAVCAQGSSQH